MVTSNLWKRLLRARVKSRRHQTGAAAASVEIEPFEPRCYLSVTSAFSAGVLSITATNSDPVAVGAASGFVTVNGMPLAVTASSVTSLNVRGGSGNNAINLSGVTSPPFTSLSSVKVDGKSGNDTIVGSAFPETLQGGDG